MDSSSHTPHTGGKSTGEPQGASRDLETKAVLRAAGAGTAVTGLLFVAGVYVFAATGASVVDPLSGVVGEVVAAQARSLESAGDTPAALAAYRDSISLRFDDPRQRVWTMREFAALLLREGETAEGIQVLREALALNPRDTACNAMLCGALLKEGDIAEAYRVASQWIALPDQAPGAQASALFHFGQALEKMGREPDALSAYRESAALDVTHPAAYHGALILRNQGQFTEALALLDAYLPHATGWRSEWARKLRDQLEAGADAHP